MHKSFTPPQQSMQQLTPQEFERIATKLTLASRTLQMQIVALRTELRATRVALDRSQLDLDESAARLTEIDTFVRDVQHELTVADATDAPTAATLSPEERSSREEQLDELYDERDEELALLEHVRALIALRETAQHKLRVVIAALTRELSVVKHKEQLLVVLALQSRLVRPKW